MPLTAGSDLERRNVPVSLWRIRPVRHALTSRIPDDASSAERELALKLALALEACTATVRVAAWAVNPTQHGDVRLGAFGQCPQLRPADASGGGDRRAVDRLLQRHSHGDALGDGVQRVQSGAIQAAQVQVGADRVWREPCFNRWHRVPEPEATAAMANIEQDAT